MIRCPLAECGWCARAADRDEARRLLVDHVLAEHRVD